MGEPATTVSAPAPSTPPGGGTAIQSGTPAPRSSTQTQTSSQSATPTGTGSPAGTPTNKTDAPTSTPEYFDIKVNGRAMKMTREEMIAQASIASSATQKFEEASRIRKEWEAKQTRMKQDPMGFLLDPSNGFTKDQIRSQMEAWYAKEFIEPETLNEDQRRSKSMEEELKAYKEREKTFREQQESEQMNSQVATFREKIQGEIIQAMEASDLPKTKEMVSRIAFYMNQNRMHGFDAPMDVVVSQVKNEITSNIRTLLNNASPQQIMAMLGDEISKKLRTHDLEEIRKKRQPNAISGSDVPRGTNDARGTGRMEKMYMGDVDQRMRRIRQGLDPNG